MGKKLKMDVTERLNFFNLQDIPPFAETILKPWPEKEFSEFKQYIYEEQRHGSASVNVFRVIGTRHPDYKDKSWLHLLMEGRRMMINLPLFQDNPEYYLETRGKEPYMHYRSIDGGDVYIGAEGNHRTCIARFFFFTQGLTTLHGITLDDYRIDWAFREACNNLKQTASKKKIPLQIIVNRELVERQDAADWRLDRFSLQAEVTDLRNHTTYNLDKEGLFRFADALGKPWWTKWRKK